MCTESTHGARVIVSQILLLMAIEDMYHMQVNDIFQILLLVVVLISGDVLLPRIVVAALCFIGYVIYERKKEIKIGGADIKILCSLFILGGVQMLVETLFVASSFGIVYALMSKRKEIPFVPFIWMGYILVII